MKIRIPSYLVSAAACGFALTASDASWAQEETAARGTLDEIITTARRVEESVQDTPVSVAAFTADDLRDRMILSSNQLAQITPNLQFTNMTTLAGNNNSSVIVIRGVGQIDPTSSVDPGVGLYIDDVYMGQSIGGTMDFRDIRTVEVLRGPQGTLFGKNSVGGAILLTTVDPGEEFGGEIRFGAGTDNLADLFAAVDVPFSDTVKSRFSFGIRQQDGYVTRIQTGEDLGDTDVMTLTGKILFDISDRFTAKVQFDYTETDENGNAMVFAASNEAATFQIIASRDAGCPGAVFPPPGVPVPMIEDDRCANDFQNKGPYANNGTYPIESKMTNWGGSLHLDFELSEQWSLKSITALRTLDWEGIRDADNTPLSILHTDYDSEGDQFSQEFRAQFTSDRLNGTAGIFYFQEKITDLVYVQLNDPAPGVQEDSDNNITDNSTWALFTQWTWDATDRLALTVGGRYTEDTKASIPDQFNYINPDAKYLPVQKYEKTFDDFSFTASGAYSFTDQVMGYLSYSEAFKGGGWNSHFNTCQILEPCATQLGLVPGTPPYNNAVAAAAAFALGIHSFGPEEAATWEVGLKMDLLDNTLRLNGAIFTTDYTDLQFTYRSGVAPYLANAGEASIDGAELEMTWLPTDAWQIDAGVGVLDSSVDSLREIAGTGIGVAVGNKLPFTPELQYNLGISFIGALGNGWTVTPRIDLLYRDDVYWDANNTEEIAVDSSYSLVNFALVVASDDSNWRARFAVTNLTDEQYSVGGNSSLTTGSGYAEIGYARPRQTYLMFEYDF
ncbi:MAG: TonB-dependent receptor [Gammaproteobacteria bacterium]|nr:TonB-dependent receptor [Gammaproteobacteria bacterium]MDH4253277.1 TonB-dependent receptor [Gammaproteobacteria bacterium]MDH5310248.1 TonB-dependent receptor [Gammaproteobacteria bacterium]